MGSGRTAVRIMKNMGGSIKMRNMGEYMGDYEAKQLILEVGRRMYNKNFVAAND